MVDEKTRQQILDFISGRNFFTTKRVVKEVNISGYAIGRVFVELENKGLIKRWNKRQWMWTGA